MLQPGAEKAIVSLFWYMALDDGRLQQEVVKNRLVSISGFTEELGHFTMSFPRSANVKKSNHLITIAPGLHQLKEKMMEGFRCGTGNFSPQNSFLVLLLLPATNCHLHDFFEQGT